MRVAVSTVCIAAMMLVFCSDDENGDDAKSKYELQLDGIANRVTVGTDLNISVQIMAGDELVSDDASTKVALVIKCGTNEVAKQEKTAVKGKASFDAIKISGDNFKGDCVVTVSAKLHGKNISKTHEFKVGDEAVITLPKPPPQDSDDEVYVPPTAPNTAIVGREFIIASTVDLKVQPNDLCDRKLALIYYDASNNTVREILTAGETIKSVDGVASGLAIVKIDNSWNVSNCVSKSDKNAPPSITIAVSPGFPKGLRLEVTQLTPPSLPASLSNKSNKIKLEWSSGATGFDNGADIFFNNATEGNEWTRYSGTPNWKKNSGGDANSTLDYALPVKALLHVKPSGERKVSHWLYFIQAK